MERATISPAQVGASGRPPPVGDRGPASDLVPEAEPGPPPQAAPAELAGDGTATGQESGVPGPAQRTIVTAAELKAGGIAGRLLRFSLANIARRPERFVLSTAGIALAVMAVIVVRTISIGFASSGSASLATVLGGAPLWVVPAGGVHYDPGTGMLISDGAPAALQVPPDWRAQRTVTGIWASPGGKLAVLGTGGVPAGHAVLGAAAAQALGTQGGRTITIGGHRLRVSISGAGKLIVVPAAVATPVTGTNGWWTVTPPPGDRGRTDLGQLLATATGLPWTADPAQHPAAAGPGLIYDTTSSSGGLTFMQRFSAQFSGKVTSSALGLVSTVGLVLGFIIAVSSFLASVQERRREFGIMSSVGLADEVLYFFLVESAIVFLTAYLAGALAAGAAVALVVPGLATLSGWLQAAGIVAAYLPAMAIIGALVPVHRLLQQRPVALLAGSS
jgi:putative ABC transport system permease protein